MYKKQMIFQRVVCFLVLAASAIVFIYSLGIITDIYESLASAVDLDLSEYDDNNNIIEYYEKIKGAAIYYDIQEFNSQLTLVGIGLVLVSLVLFVFCTHSRRRYYIGNFFSVALSVVACGASTFWALPMVEKFKQQFVNEVDFAQMAEYAERWGTKYTDSTFWFDAGYVVFGLLVLANILLIVNLVLKLILMKEEKRTIGSRKDVRA